jgi:hypothetical protein
MTRRAFDPRTARLDAWCEPVAPVAPVGSRTRRVRAERTLPAYHGKGLTMDEIAAVKQARADILDEVRFAPRDPCFMCGVRGDVACRHRA